MKKGRKRGGWVPSDVFLKKKMCALWIVTLTNGSYSLFGGVKCHETLPPTN